MYYKTIAATGAIIGQMGYAKSLLLTAGVDDAAATIYDNASAATGNVVAKLAAKAGTSVFVDTESVHFYNGLYASITGTAPSLTTILV